MNQPEPVYVFTQQQLLDFLEEYFAGDFDASGRESFFAFVDEEAKRGKFDRRMENRCKIKSIEVIGKANG